MYRRTIIYIATSILLQSCVGHCLNSYSGQVTDAKTNQPIANVRVILWVNDQVVVEPESGNTMLTDSLGQYKIEIMTGSCWDNTKIIFCKDGYSPKVSDKLTNNITTLDMTLDKIN